MWDKIIANHSRNYYRLLKESPLKNPIYQKADAAVLIDHKISG